MKEDMARIVRYIKEIYDASVELCGEDDEINTIPSKEMYELAQKLYQQM